jgi:hypothetical protein
MRGIRAKMIRKHLAKHFPKEELKVKIHYGSRNSKGQVETFPKTFRYSANSFQRNYRDVKRIAA